MPRNFYKIILIVEFFKINHPFLLLDLQFLRYSQKDNGSIFELLTLFQRGFIELLIKNQPLHL